MPETGILLNYLNIFEVRAADATGDTGWLRLAAGFKSFSAIVDEVTDDTPYFDGDGTTKKTVTGVTRGHSFTADRSFGNEAQEFIINKVDDTGVGREIEYQHTEPDGKKHSGKATLFDLMLPGGDPNTKGEFSFSITWDKPPTVTP